jgi:hypothetical protein
MPKRNVPEITVALVANGDGGSVTEALCVVEEIEKTGPEYQAKLLDFLISNLLLGKAIRSRYQRVHKALSYPRPCISSGRNCPPSGSGPYKGRSRGETDAGARARVEFRLSNKKRRVILRIEQVILL